MVYIFFWLFRRFHASDLRRFYSLQNLPNGIGGKLVVLMVVVFVLSLWIARAGMNLRTADDR